MENFEALFFKDVKRWEQAGIHTLRAMIARTFMQPCRRSLIGR